MMFERLQQVPSVPERVASLRAKPADKVAVNAPAGANDQAALAS